MLYACDVCLVCVHACVAEDAVREMLCKFSLSRGLAEVGTVTAEDQLDDGSIIRLAITIDRCVTESGTHQVWAAAGNGGQWGSDVVKANCKALPVGSCG
jgi:hypothetical protein